MIKITSLKKIILPVLLLAGTTALAQLKGAPKTTVLWFGPKVGMNVSSFYSDTSTAYNQFKVDFLGGAAVNFTFIKNLSVQAEVNYSPKGAKFRSHTDSTETHVKYALNYLDVPLLFQVKGGDEESSMFFQIGAQKSFLLSAKYSAEFKDASTTVSINNSNLDSLNLPKSDFEVLAGFGVITESGWCFTLRANAGLGDIPDTYQSVINHNISFQASLGYFFGRKYDVIGGRRR